MKPLLFDTSALFTAKPIRGLREKYPDRVFMLPCIVIAERVNQLRREHGEGFDPQLVKQFIEHPTLDLQQVAFDRQDAEVLAEIAFKLGEAWYPEWPAVQRNVRDHPCGQRCRWADHAVTALAIARNALLVTEDKAILQACKADTAFFPEVCCMADLL